MRTYEMREVQDLVKKRILVQKAIMHPWWAKDKETYIEELVVEEISPNEEYVKVSGEWVKSGTPFYVLEILGDVNGGEMKSVEVSFGKSYPTNWESVGEVYFNSEKMPRFLRIDGIEYQQTDLINNGEPY